MANPKVNSLGIVQDASAPLGLVKYPYYKRTQAAKAWREEKARTPEEKAAAMKAWAAKQADRRHAEEKARIEEYRRAEKLHAATKTSMGQALLRAGLIGRK